MKRIILMLSFSLASLFCYGQYKGSKYIAPFAGITGESFNSFQAGISGGYLFSNELLIDLPLNYRAYNSRTVKGDFFTISPTLFHRVFARRKFSFLIGAGAMAGYLSLKSKEEFTEIVKPNNFVYSVLITPRIEALFSPDFSFFIQYSFEYQINSIQSANHIACAGVIFYF